MTRNVTVRRYTRLGKATGRKNVDLQFNIPQPLRLIPCNVRSGRLRARLPSVLLGVSRPASRTLAAQGLQGDDAANAGHHAFQGSFRDDRAVGWKAGSQDSERGFDHGPVEDWGEEV